LVAVVFLFTGKKITRRKKGSQGNPFALANMLR
jgi:hypothetical protein